MTKRNGLLSTIALAVAGAIVATMVVSCGIRPSVVIPGQQAPRGVQTGMIVYLIDHGNLRAVNRPLPPTDSTLRDPFGGYPAYPGAQAALDALVAGPTASEAAGGLTSEVPATNVFTDIPSDAKGNVYQVYFVVKDGTSASLTQHAVDQIVCTVSAAFISTGNIPTGSSVMVQVLENKTTTRQAQVCPATP